MKHLIPLLIFTFAIVSISFGQHLHQVEFLESLSTFELQQETDLEVDNGVDLYKVNYYTTGSDGLPDTASGLLVIPTVDKDDFPVVVYHHGTSPRKSAVPSSLELEFAAYAGIGGMGFIVLAPDYLGMGDSRGFHPYVHRETQASASIDMLRAFQEWVASEPFSWNEQLFLTGYSQGGHASMSTHWALESQHFHEYEVTAATHLSGPYSISEVMKDNMFSSQTYLFTGYIPYAILGYQEVYGDFYEQLQDVFRPQFVNNIQQFYNGNIDLIELNLRVAATLFSLCTCLHPVEMFNPAFVNAINNEEDHPGMAYLRENDTYDWAPQAPTRIFYCEADDQVPFQNSVLADSVMQLNGAVDLATVDFGNLNHVNCATPVLLSTVDFFLEFTETSEVSDQAGSYDFRPYPNPSSGDLYINGAEDSRINVRIYNLQGMEKLTFSHRSHIDLHSLKNGMYIVEIDSPSGRHHYRVVLQR